MLSRSVVQLLCEWIQLAAKNQFVPGPYLTDFQALQWFVDGFLACYNLHQASDPGWASFVAYLRDKGIVQGTEDVFDAVRLKAGGTETDALRLILQLLKEQTDSEQLRL